MHPSKLLPLILLAGLAPSAWADIYKCTDPDGRVTYTNDRSLGRGCVRLESDQAVSTIPAPPRSPAASTPKGTPAAATPGSFPRVSPDDQRNRDDARLKVLAGELEHEEKSLAEAEQALAEQESIRTGDERNYQKVLDRLQPFKDKVELHKRNIEALRREISGLR
ncbi:DUF4124 domain-containing protein [Thauera sp. WH-2]|uniref:DUF4124 domain-containing protein n=1 Tax=Thauera sp. WH-2 TaxID=3401574 RepID=UPI003AAD7974